MTSGSDPGRLLAGVSRLYGESLAEHGATSQAVGWRDEASQRLRFDKLFQLVADDEDEVSVADLGCGYGAMFDYLAERLGGRLVAYVGIDVNPGMVAAARARVADPRASFAEGALPQEPCSHAFVSGTFNVKLEASDAEWEEFVRDTLRSLARLAGRGLAFNLLTDQVDWREEQLFYASPGRFLDFCRHELSRSVALLHDYPLYEWTMLVRLAP